MAVSGDHLAASCDSAVRTAEPQDVAQFVTHLLPPDWRWASRGTAKRAAAVAVEIATRPDADEALARIVGR
jgi:hypothetical protein